MRLLLYLSEQEFASKEFPLAVKAIQSEFYVDDLLSGDHTVEGAIEKQKQICSLLSTAQLSIRKWCSNSETVLNNIPDEIKEVPDSIKFEETEFKKTLGMYWNPHEDIFSYSINIENYNPNQLSQ